MSRMIVVLMGVSGAGKTTIGELLAKRLRWPLIEGDDYHPAANVSKMAAGIPLTDEDRWPWLDTLNQRIREERDAIVTCSALKESYRRRLFDGVRNARLVYLHAPKAVLAARVAARKHRYMPASLLDSQLATLEPPAGAIDIDVSGNPEACVEAILAALGR
jgi:gluconokinase